MGTVGRTRALLPVRAKAIPGLLPAAVCCLWLAGEGHPRAEQACDLTRIAELPMENHGERGPIVPVRIEGRTRKLLLDTGGFSSILDPSVIRNRRALGTSMQGVLGLGSEPLTRSVQFDSIELGQATLKRVDFLVGPPSYGNVDGTIGADILRGFDVELDPVKGTASLFAQSRCGRGAIYWAHEDETAVPFILDPEDQHIFMNIQLDGKDIRAMVDTGSPDSLVSMTAARSLLGLDENSPGMESAWIGVSRRGKPENYYRYRFSSLALGGLRLDSPWMVVAPSMQVDMIVGIHQLHMLHLYFAFGEHMLYATTAGPGGDGPDPAVRTKAEDLVENARTAREKDDLVSAEAAVEHAIAIDRTYAAAYGERARIHLAREERQLARSDLETAVRLDPRDVEAWRAMTALDIDAGDAEKARADVEQAIRDNPSDPAALFLRATVESVAARHEDALRDADAAVAMAPMRPQSYLSRSTFYASAGDYAKAYADVDRALRLRPNLPRALNDRCWFGALMGKLDDALDDCDEAVRLRPKSASFLDSRAFVQLKRGRFDKALSDYDAALVIAPRAASSLYGRGLVKQQKGDVTAAADIEAAKAIDPDIESHFGK
jgi:tetratricopeptide (TPR) repeat protein